MVQVVFKNSVCACRDHNRMVFGFKTTCSISARSWRGVLNTTLCDLRQVSGFSGLLHQ
jgi:hypothetical protein